MNDERFNKIFIVNEITRSLYNNPDLLVESSNDAVKSAALMSLLDVQDKERVSEILSKIKVCITELIMNIYSYSNEIKFFIGIELFEHSLRLSFRFYSDEFDADSIMDTVLKKEKMLEQGKSTLNGMGFVLIKRNSDRMRMLEIKNNNNWNREIELEFSIK